MVRKAQKKEIEEATAEIKKNPEFKDENPASY